MWIKEQESRFCNEITANPFYLSTLPSKAQFRRQHFTSAYQLWARLVTPHPAQLWWTEGQEKLLTDHHHFFGKAKYPFKKNQTQPPIPGSWRWPESASIGDNTATLHQGTTKTRHPLPEAALVCSSGDKLLPVLQAGNSEPLLITMITSWFCFLWTSLPLPAFEEATCHMLSGMFWNRPV